VGKGADIALCADNLDQKAIGALRGAAGGTVGMISHSRPVTLVPRITLLSERMQALTERVDQSVVTDVVEQPTQGN
jgi:hypothetical protein